MLIAAVFVLGVALCVVIGGDLSRLAALRLRSPGLVVLGLISQILAFAVLPQVFESTPVVLVATLHLMSYGAAGLFLWRNARVPGLWLVAVGAALNGITIALNGGTLPASAAALRTIGPVGATQPGRSGLVNSDVLAHPVLPWLGDVFAVPAPVPLANVFSIGDVLVVAGGLHFLCRVCGTWWTAPWGAVDRTGHERSADRGSIRAMDSARQRPGRVADQRAQIGQEPCRLLAVDHPMVEGHRQLHHLPGPDAPVVHPGTIPGLAETDDRGLTRR
jgi:hypothetical protein